jgi:hypothetical protein
MSHTAICDVKPGELVRHQDRTWRVTESRPGWDASEWRLWMESENAVLLLERHRTYPVEVTP